MRLFFAIELPTDVRDLLDGLRPRDDNRAYRWVDAALMHVTLAFLGEQPSDAMETLERVGDEAARTSRPGRLRLGHTGSFGGQRAPRVLWVDLGGDVDALFGLQSNLDRGLRSAGFALEERAFRPHVTLARRREHAIGGAPRGWPPAVDARPFALDKLTLFQSRLSPRGPSYTPLLEFRLSGGIVASTNQRP